MARRNNDILGEVEQIQVSTPVPDVPNVTPEHQELQDWVKTTEEYAKCLEDMKTTQQAIEEKITELRDILAAEQQLSKEINTGTPDFQAYLKAVKDNNNKYGDIFRRELAKVADGESVNLARKVRKELDEVLITYKNELNEYVRAAQQRIETVRRNNDVFTISWNRWWQLAVFYGILMILAGFLFHEIFEKYHGLEVLLIVNLIALFRDMIVTALRYVVGWTSRK